MDELTFLAERDEALFAAYKNALRQPDCKSHQQAISMAINSPTSQFWISPLRGYRSLLLYKKGVIPSNMNAHRRELADDLYKEYLRLKDTPAFRGCSTFFISQFVCGRPARGFYISYITAKRIIRRKRNEKRR